MSHQPNHIYEFGSFRLDVAERMLLRNRENVPLQPKAFDLLLVLVRRHGHLLEKEELLEAVWPDAIVEEVNLANNVPILRKALSEGGNERQFIETVPRRGYRFVAPVREEEEGIGGEEADQSPVVVAEQEDLVVAETNRQVTLELTGDERQMLTRRYTGNKQAYLLYLKGRYHWNKNTPAGYWKAIEYFRQALAEDHRYAPAYSWLAASYNLLGINSELPPQEAETKARMYASKALELDEAQDMAHVVLGSLKLFYEWDWPGAERELKRAIELNPGNVEGRLAYAYYLAFVGRTNEAVAEVKKGEEMDPLSMLINTAVATMLYLSLQNDQAIEQCRKTLELDANFSSAHYWLGMAYLEKSMKTEAIAEMNRWITLSGRDGKFSPDLGYLYAASGRRVEAEKVLNELKELSTRSYADPLDIARIHLALGQKDQTFAWLEKAYEKRSMGIMWLKVHPQLKSLRSDPRYQDLLRRMRLTE